MRFFVVNKSMSEISSFFVSQGSPASRLATPASGGFVITTNDSRGSDRCHGGKIASALMKETVSRRIEAGNITCARFRSLPPCRRRARTAFFPIPRFFGALCHLPQSRLHSPSSSFSENLDACPKFQRPRNATSYYLGATSGISRSIARQYAERGAVVCVVGRRGALVEEVVKECRQTRSSLHDVLGCLLSFGEKVRRPLVSHNSSL